MTDPQTRWFALDVTADPVVSDAVEGVLNQYDALGIEIDQLRKKPEEDIVVTGYFDESVDIDSIRLSLATAVEAFDRPQSTIRNVGWREVVQQDWLAEWKKHWRPTHIGKFVIAPPWEDIDEDGGIVIRIEPNMAFGTGTHETTKLCIGAISELYRPRWTVLDVGTGTGILAIAAAKLGAETISACDTDADSVKIARKNAELNDTSAIEFSHGTLGSEGPKFDLVLGNLTLDVIEPLLGTLLSRTQAVLILSGILAEQEGSIVANLRNRGIESPAVSRMGEWISVVIQK